MTLSFRLSHDAPLTRAFLDYELEVIPVFAPFEPHDRLEIALDDPDYEQVARWMGERIAAFVHPHLTVQFTRQSEGDEVVEDPVARTRFPKAAAHSSREYRGQTYHFVSAQTRRAFEKDPASYLEPSGATPGKDTRFPPPQPAPAARGAA
jgi:YHS domain-containing protein